MVAGESHQGTSMSPREVSLPPITALAITSLALIVVGGVYVASYVPRTVPLLPAVVLLALAGILTAVEIGMLARLREFAWQRFFQVFKWALLAYLVIAGMIGYAFTVDGTRGSVLAVLILMLSVFAIDIPLLLAFSVARYAE